MKKKKQKQKIRIKIRIFTSYSYRQLPTSKYFTYTRALFSLFRNVTELQ